MRILLANPPWIVNEKKGVRAGSRWPHLKTEEEGDYLPYPFFLGYSSSLLKSKGYEVKLIDAIAEDMSIERFIKKVVEFKPDFILVETSTPSLIHDLKILKKLKEKTNALIAISGMDYTIRQPNFLENKKFIDFVLYGEYEMTLLDLIKHLEDHKNLEEVDGLIFRDKNSKTVVNKARKLVDVNKLPWPDRESVPIYHYIDSPGAMPLPCAQMIASRGCPYRCIFCVWPQMMYHSHAYRFRDVKDVVDEMEYLVKVLGFKSVYFDDDTFNIGKERMLRFAEEVKKRKLNIPFAIMGRADLMDKEVLLALKEAGLYAVKYGVESADQKLLDNAHKNLDIKKAERIIKLTKNLGIKTHLTFMFGLPGETKETIKKTIEFALRMDPYSLQFSIATPFPGTEYYKELKAKGQLVESKLSDFDGNFKAVIKTKELSPHDLEVAVRKAYERWEEHLKSRRIRENKSAVVLFKECLGEHGWRYTLKHTLRYIKNRKRKRIPTKTKKNPKRIKTLLLMCPMGFINSPPMSIALLESYLKNEGYEVAAKDLNIEVYHSVNEELKSYWKQKNIADDWVEPERFKKEIIPKIENLLEFYSDKFAKSNYDIIGFSVYSGNRNFSLELARRIKNKNKRKLIIFGGFIGNDEKEREFIKKEKVDYLVVGEGEETLKQIIDSLENKRSAEKVKGVFVPKTGNFIPREPRKDLKNLPIITFESFDLNKYENLIIPLFLSRGCIGHCAFCNDWITTKPFRSRPAEDVVRDIKFYIKKYHYKIFNFIDLLINGDIKNLERMCDLIIDEKLDIKWSAQAIALGKMNERILKKMKASGCETLLFGIETGSNKILRKVGKLFTIEEAERVIRETKKVGIGVGVNIIVGFPWETEEDFQQTLNFLIRNKNYINRIDNVNLLYITPGSILDLKREKFGIRFPKINRPNVFWEYGNGKELNTYEIREKRVIKMLQLAAKLGIKVCSTNIYEKEEEHGKVNRLFKELFGEYK